MTPRLGQVPFREAIDFFRAKALLGTDGWTDTWHEAHQVSFVVAGARNMAMLADFRAAVDEAIATGLTKDEFQRQFVAIARRYGWTYRGSPGWRSRVILETNLRMAYSAGRWAQIDELKAERPLLRYSAVMDNRTRLLHRQWHGTILPVGHPWWNTHFPPNGWSCRCSVTSLAQRDLARRGWKVSDPAPGVTMVNRQVTGRGMIEVPEGIDPGFGYNPGDGAVLRQAQARAAEAARRAPGDIAEAARPALVPPPDTGLPAAPSSVPASKPAASLDPAAPLPAPRVWPADRLLPAGLTEQDYADRFLGEFGATMEAPAAFEDVSGAKLWIGAAAVTNRVTGALKVLKHGDAERLVMLADTIKSPDEIWQLEQTIQVPGKGRLVRIIRRYIARWQTADRLRGGFSVAEVTDDGLVVQTAFEPRATAATSRGAEEYLAQQRQGELVFRRGE